MFTDMRKSHIPIAGKIQRKEYGQGSKEEALKVRIGKDKKKEELRVEIGERQYTQEEIKKIFSQCETQMETWILGKNKSLNRIETNMNLIREIPDQPIDVEWELSRYDIMNSSGELQKAVLEKKGTMIDLNAVLTYRERPKDQAQFQCAIAVYPRTVTKQEEFKRKVVRLVKEEDEKTRTKGSVTLPNTVDGEVLTYYSDVEYKGIVVVIMGILAGGLLLALEKQEVHKKEKEKQKQMLLDYPEIMNKLTLFLGAGMTVKQAWGKMLTDYEEQKQYAGSRYIYEEMRITWHEMQSGITEAKSYERFGRRVNMAVYIKFGALLSQNLRKGTKGLNELLKMEALQAFEERKANARRLGEEAGTKLLLPMFLMLGIVLIIVVIPAFLSIQM